MLKLGAKEKRIGTPVMYPSCRHPNLGIDIWCERCRTPLEWNGQSAHVATDSPVPPTANPPTHAASPVLPSANATYCENCGTAGARGARFCQGCGRGIAAGATRRESRRRRAGQPRAFALAKLTVPTFALPRLRMPSLTLPRARLPRMAQLRLPRVPRIVLVVGTVLVVLLIVPLAYMLLPAGRPVASRQGTPPHLPSTSATVAAGTPQAAAIPGVEAKTGLHYGSGKCASGTACLSLVSQTVGQDAAAVVFSTAGSAGRQCVGYVYRSGGHWQFLDAACGLPGQLSPLVGHDATVHVPGNCANVRDGASLKASVVACLNDGTTVHIDGGPTYADARVWWHEKRGWLAHDFLVGP